MIQNIPKKRVLYVAAVSIIALLTALIVVVTVQLRSEQQNQETDVSAIEPASSDVCKEIPKSKIESIMDHSYDKPQVTKVGLGTGISSQTCSYESSEGDTDKFVQIVVSYQAEESSPETIGDVWETTKQGIEGESINFAQESLLVEGNALVLFAFDGNNIVNVQANAEQSILQEIAGLIIE